MSDVFGILICRFQVLWQPIHTPPQCVIKIVFASVALHYYFRIPSRDAPAPAELLDHDLNNSRVRYGNWHHSGVGGGLQHLQVKENLKAYFNSDGRIPWQREMVHLE